MVNGIIGKKIGMTQLFLEDGTVEPATVLQAGPCVVVQAKLAERDGYEAVQLGLVGGKYKGGNFADLIGPLTSRGRGVVAIGEARPLVREALGAVVPLVEAGSMADAVAKAREMARPGSVVLLAPACSSFDMFSDYAARGRAFKEAVAKLGTEG